MSTPDPAGPVVAWFRRDLRLHDHPALAEAARRGTAVVPLFVLDPRFLDGPRASASRRWFLLGSLAALDADLRARGSGLVVRMGRPEDVVPAVAAEAGAGSVLATRDVTPFARRRDRAVAAALAADGRSLHLRRGLLLVEPEDVPGTSGVGYTVFTPFWRATQKVTRRPLATLPERLPALPPIASDPLPAAGTAPAADLPEPGETAARGRLARWVAGGLGAYGERRNDLAGSSTSRLGADLHLGLLSPLEIEAACDAAGSAEQYTRQLAWREFYHHLLWHRPELAWDPFQPRFADVFRPLAADPDGAAAWMAGRTGIPAVDAGMRQLAATGWMPNRARMVVASFLTRHLLLDWRIGEAHFARLLIDGDLANNVGGWQWTAGVGTDAQPWFRIFNPVLQGERFDADGTWVRTWIPELAQVPASAIHQPWTLAAGELRRLGADAYPAPIVDLAEARTRALAAFSAASGS
ncbi:MAG: cryptochrome/photolyase family protein [Chloroflexota bacterium]